MKKYRIRKPFIYGIYVLTFISVFGSIYFIEKSIKESNSFNEKNFKYIYNIPDDRVKPVSKEIEPKKTKIIRPYYITDAVIVQNYYDYKDDASKQVNSLIYYDDTYLQSTGVAYTSPKQFDVVSILDGTITSIKDDQLLGKVVEITHNNNLISVYQSLGEVDVKENEFIKQGDIIGISGENNISKEIGNHLYFELIQNGINVNPEEYFDKNVDEI